MIGVRRACLALALAVGATSAATAQDAPPPAVQSPILTLDQERLFTSTLWGKRAEQRIEAASAALAAENRQIEAELTAEEKDLTEKRPTMPADEFQKAAEAFDAKVTEIRNRQDAKTRAIGQMRDAERQKFFGSALPVMTEVLRAKGAVVVLDSRAIFLAADAIDVTDELIAQIDAELGAGEDVPVPDAPAAPDGAGEGAPAPADPGSGN